MQGDELANHEYGVTGLAGHHRYGGVAHEERQRELANQTVNLAANEPAWKGLTSLPHLARLAIAVIALQLLFWLIVKPLVIGSPAPPFDTIDGYDFEQAQISSPTLAAVDQAEFEVIAEMPAWHCCESGYRAFRYKFDLEEVPERGLGIAPHIRADNFSIYVNNRFIAGTGRMELPDQTYDSMIRETYHIPSSAISTGRNQATFILVREGIPYFDYFPPVLAEYSYIEQRLERTNWLSGGYTYIVIAMIGMVALFSLIFFLISGRERDAFWLFVLSAALAASNHYYVWTDPPFGGHFRVFYFHALTLTVQFAWFGWADAWSRDRYRWSLPLAAFAFAGAVAATAYSLTAMPYGAGYDRAGEIMVYCGIGFAIATATRILWNFRKLEEDRYIEAALAILLVSLFVLQVTTELTQALNMGYMTRTQPFLIIGIAVAFFARRVRLFRSSAQINALLEKQLEERTEELAVAHHREKRLIRTQALDEERQRIMRDMHDGLGSHLMSMLMMAKRGAGDHVDYAEGLQSVIDEMRLMIDSMDSVGESLRSALTVFRKRVVPRAGETGFAITWLDKSAGEFPDLGPREVLQVFRILQEAITNSLKHSGGDTIAIAIEDHSDQAGAMKITIADNGSGLGRGDGAGRRPNARGIKNMQARAAGIGAQLDLHSSDEGLTVALVLEERT